ncbi:hypothetical protein HMPREF1981_03420 [Bacteroides pyogenes F0041]|uniref:Uncharacterized protein n=1 Tax=Bacteroides pyogenes F0041 TaxID=1321819 RepID=U2DHS6_9BACE|nr:hypothetical protein HMPREF1981_03420 [Bacteroides pyogenes F0041]MBB3895223.1 hypothetical protein [Bacteroides pyogenes]GAE21745.1 hypothetical protein JCM10003_1238 [Bacteroides pyogenes JCM 10003]SUV30759.1 Uncharacterised protein [Bacteroides pyogenes]
MRHGSFGRHFDSACPRPAKKRMNRRSSALSFQLLPQETMRLLSFLAEVQQAGFYILPQETMRFPGPHLSFYHYLIKK